MRDWLRPYRVRGGRARLRLRAEWRADGDLRDEVPCWRFQAEIRGSVPYGPGRAGQAWQFRSCATQGGDPNYIAVPASAGHVYRSVTVDAWVQQIGRRHVDRSSGPRAAPP